MDVFSNITIYEEDNKLLTIQQVAELAGVSSATVSRVLNNPERVKENTKEKVLKVIQSVNYQPNSAGQSLRLNKSHMVMVTLPDITNTFFSRVVRGIKSAANDCGYDVLLFETTESSNSEDKIKQFISTRKVDGIIHLSAKTRFRELLLHYEETSVVLACEYMEQIDFPSVSIDNVAAAMDATKYLTTLGHREILYVNGPTNMILCRDRLRGYRFALDQSGVAFEDELVLFGDFTMRSGYSVVAEALERKLQFTAVFCANDAMAIGAMKALQERGIRIPQDVSVVGFDDIEFASYSQPSLTTVTQPSEEIGRAAMKMWIKINDGEVITDPVKLQHRMTIRESSGFVKKEISV